MIFRILVTVNANNLENRISQELLGVLDFSSFVDAESQKDQSGMVEEEETRF